MKCERCGIESNVSSVSYLSTEEVCVECKEVEKNHPLYDFGKRIELSEVKKGNTKFKGILDGFEGKPSTINIMAQIKYEDTPEKIGCAFSNIVNNFSFDSNCLANTFTTNGIDFVEECKSWVYYMATTNRVDGRNQAAKERCMELTISKQPLLPVASYMANEHRTLQQSYTRFVLDYLLETPNYLPMV